MKDFFMKNVNLLKQKYENNEPALKFANLIDNLNHYSIILMFKI